MEKIYLDTRVLDGKIYISLDSLSAALKARAAEYLDAARDSSFEETRTAYYAVAQELEYRSDMLNFASIAYHEDRT